MTKRGTKNTELERVADRGWMFTARYTLLLLAVQRSTRLGKWTSVIGTAAMATAIARGFR